MIGLDTNVLIRYVVQDDPVQSRKAVELIEQNLSELEPGFVSVVVLAEFAWVLGRAYRMADQDIAATIEGILQSDVLMVERELEVYSALSAVKEGRGSFGDALIGALGQRAGCTQTLTFDRGALRLPGFALA